MPRERPEGQVQQTERRQDRHRFAELAVIRRLPSPQRRVVHARQVVEDQRRGVHELGRCGGRRPLWRDVPPQSSADNMRRTGRTRFDGACSV